MSYGCCDASNADVFPGAVLPITVMQALTAVPGDETEREFGHLYAEFGFPKSST